MALWILLITLLAFLIYLLLMPLELCLDSYQNRYYLSMGGLARASVEKDPVELARLHLKVLFLNFYWRPSDLKRRKASSGKRDAQKKGRRSRNFPVHRIRQLMQSFRVRSFRLELDTGDPVLNAKLYPLACLLQRQAVDIHMNFVNRNHIYLQITNRPIDLLKAFINH